MAAVVIFFKVFLLRTPRVWTLTRIRVRREIGEYLARLVAKRNIVDYDDEIADLPNLDDETYLALNWSQQVISDLSRLQSN
jgi:hypothetical protein